MTGTIPSLFDATCERFPNRVAVRWEEGELTYHELRRQAYAVAHSLRSIGVGPHDRVVLALGNGPEYLRAFFGAGYLGALVVPLNPLLRAEETRYYLTDSGAKAVVHAGGADLIRGVATDLGVGLLDLSGCEERDDVDRAPVEGTDIAVLLYTSGTTGEPKGAQLTHVGLLDNSHAYVADVLEGTGQDVLAAVLPLFHIFGLTCAVLAAVHLGATLSTVRRFKADEFLATLADDGVTVLAGVPTIYIALLEAAAGREVALPALRLCISGGAPMPPDYIARVEQAFGAAFLEGYGLTESSACVAFNRMGMDRRAGTIGLPVLGVEVRLVDDDGEVLEGDVIGEIEIRGSNVTTGYWNKPSETAEAFHDAWFRTGDLARRCDDGVLQIVDRKKQIIIRGGYNVYPREIEEVLYTHPDVLEVAVVGIPNHRLGEEVAAAVVLRRGARATSDELVAYAKERVAPYKYPRIVWLTDALPRSDTGKILRRKVQIPSEALR
jgi:long-chain acyl-CoA synthetase